MKRNKFRVWSKKRKGWLTSNDHSLHCTSNWMMDIFTGKIIDFTLVGEEYHADPEPTWYRDGNGVVEESPYVIQQCTGIFDKNNKEIYEGDIVSFFVKRDDVDSWNEIRVVKWYKHSWSIFDGFSQYPHEVIGNIFENPELLNINA